MPMNEFFLDDLNDDARMASFDNACRSLHELYAQLRAAARHGRVALVVVGDITAKNHLLGVLRQNQVLVTESEESGVVRTVFSGWQHRDRPAREIAATELDPQ